MKYTLKFSSKALKQLKKLNPAISALIVKWMEKNIQGCENPRLHGKSLVGDRSGQWRYRVGDYRIICEIQDSRLIVLVITVGHRREVYNSDF